MFFSGDFRVRKTRSGFVISVIGEDNSVRITNNEIDNVFSDEDSEMIAILLGVIEFSRHQQMAIESDYNPAFIPERIIEREDILSKINYLLECEMITIDCLINRLSQMKYFEIIEFFEKEFDEEFYEEVAMYN